MLSITVLLPQNWSEKDLLNILKAQNNHYSCQLHRQLQYKETGIVGIVFQPFIVRYFSNLAFSHEWILVCNQTCCSKLWKSAVEKSTKPPIFFTHKLKCFVGEDYNPRRLIPENKEPMTKFQFVFFLYDLISWSGCSSPSLWKYDLSSIVSEMKENSEFNLVWTTAL